MYVFSFFFFLFFMEFFSPDISLCNIFHIQIVSFFFHILRIVEYVLKYIYLVDS